MRGRPDPEKQVMHGRVRLHKGSHKAVPLHTHLLSAQAELLAAGCWPPVLGPQKLFLSCRPALWVPAAAASWPFV